MQLISSPLNRHMKIFEQQIQVGMGDCDPAGMLYYPRYIEMISKVIEGWFTTGLDYDFNTLHLVENYAVPTVDIHTKFIAPSRLSETLTFQLKLLTLKSRSLQVEIEARHEKEQRLVSVSSLVFCKTKDQKIGSVEIPPMLRLKMQDFL